MKTLSLPPQTAQVRLAVDIVALSIQDGLLMVLLVQRGRSTQNWALPGRFVRTEEGLIEAAIQELQDKTKVRLAANQLKQLHTFAPPSQDPRGRLISVAYLTTLAHTEPIDLTDASWHLAHRPPRLAPEHQQMLQLAIGWLQTHLELPHTAQAFVHTFTLPELQEVHEAILNRALDKRNFRKRMMALDQLKPAGERRVGVGRPAQLYTWLNPSSDTP